VPVAWVSLKCLFHNHRLRLLDVVDLDLLSLLVEDGQRTRHSVPAKNYVSRFFPSRTAQECLCDHSAGVLLKLLYVETASLPHLPPLIRCWIVIDCPHGHLAGHQLVYLAVHVVRLLDLVDDKEASKRLRWVVLVSRAHRCGHQRDSMGGLAGPRWGRNDELLRL